MNATSQRWMLWAGVVLASIYFFGYAFLMKFFPPPPPSLSAEDVVQLYAEHNTRFRIGVVLALICGGFNQFWTVVIAAQMVRDEKGVPVWAIMQGTAGTLGTALFFLPPLFWGVASFSIGRDPGLTLLMHELAFLTFITPVCMFPLQAIPIAVICLSKKEDEYHSAFPRWLGYFSLWMTISAEAGVAALMFKSGPFAWNGLFPFWLPLSIFGFWIGAIIFMILRALKRQEQSAQA